MEALPFLSPANRFRFPAPRGRACGQLSSPSHNPSCHLPAGGPRVTNSPFCPPQGSRDAPERSCGFRSHHPPTKATREPERWWDVGTTAPNTQGQAFGDTASLEFTAECPTASAWEDARAFSQILHDPPGAEGTAALPACIIHQGDNGSHC